MSVLSRLTATVRGRDWGTALIDIGVVAIGILMALAVDDWNKEQEATAQRLELLKLAYDEVRNNEATVDDQIEELKKDLESLSNAYNVVADSLDDAALSAEQCELILLSPIIPNSMWTLPTVEGLASTQQLNSPEDMAVRSAAQDFLDALEYQRREERLSISDQINLFRAHPELFSVGLSTRSESRALIDARALDINCDLQAMRESNAFLSALSINYRSQAVLANGAKGNVQDRTHALRLALEKRLKMAQN